MTPIVFLLKIWWLFIHELGTDGIEIMTEDETDMMQL
jgi:hypothetical protein